MDQSEYYVKLNQDGHSTVYCEGHLLLGSEVIEVENQLDQNHDDSTAIIMLANGTRISGVKVIE
ncbi:hypothetical protein [Vibrio mediterranei]|uniref:Uncharacterized protein n=1 Tax=Vibrio mediterranei TaxID=689 RepID=A0AAN1FHK0_9VIBR|nr:hypothetical protein [Vibrio mediterranei]ASI90774.1 hypothetical protein BSZ05_13785 [Vibrio mediterranei]